MTDDRPADFQRARSAEQREVRKRTILAAAAELLTEMPVSDISLRELSRRVGLSKTNVVRYFETREAVFFALLNQELAQWIEELPAELAEAEGETEAEAEGRIEAEGETEAEGRTEAHAVAEGVADPAGQATPRTVSDALARSLARRTLLCELLSSLGSELERNISAASALDFKRAHTRLLGALAELLHRHMPTLSPAAARELVSLTVVCAAGLWPFAHPSPAVVEAQQDPELADTKVDFADRLSRTLHIATAGLLSLG